MRPLLLVRADARAPRPRGCLVFTPERPCVGSGAGLPLAECFEYFAVLAATESVTAYLAFRPPLAAQSLHVRLRLDPASGVAWREQAGPYGFALRQVVLEAPEARGGPCGWTQVVVDVYPPKGS